MKQPLQLAILLGCAALAAGLLLTASIWPQESTSHIQRQSKTNQNSNVATANTNTNNTNTAPVVANTNSVDSRNTAFYQNAELGFSLLLPSGWSTDPARSSIEETVFTSGETGEHREAVKRTRTAQTVDAWAATFASESGYSVTNYSVDGQSGKRVRFDGIGADYIGVKIDDQLYVITVGRMAENGMLASIHFVP